MNKLLIVRVSSILALIQCVEGHYVKLNIVSSLYLADIDILLLSLLHIRARNQNLKMILQYQDEQGIYTNVNTIQETFQFLNISDNLLN